MTAQLSEAYADPEPASRTPLLGRAPLAEQASAWQESPALTSREPAEHVFDSTAWLGAWESTTAETRDWHRYLRHGSSSGASALTPFYLVRDSPMWNSYETDAGVGPVWSGPVVSTPSLYAVYGAKDAAPARVEAVVDLGLNQARRDGAQALVVGNLEPGVAAEWAGLRPPSLSMVLDRTYRADVSGGVDSHLSGLTSHARREFRRQWRRSRERGVQLTVLEGAAATPRLLELAALAEATAVRHGPALYTLETFAAMSGVPGAVLLLAEREGVAVGAFLVFRHDRSLYLWAGGYDYACRSALAPYAFLLYESIAYAVATGCHYVEAGRGNFAYKERHGFRPIDLWSLVYLTPGARHDELLRRLRRMDRRLRTHLSLTPLSHP